jgi:lipopolysaccharide transport system permease protein
MLALYVLVFGYIFQGKFGVLPNETRADYGLGIFLGLSLFHFFSEILAASSTIIVSNPNFVKKVVFPLEILPAAAVCAALFHLLISLGLVVLGMLFFGHGISLGILWLPAIIIPLSLLGLGVSWILSAVGVFFRDINQIMQFMTAGLMFASAVFYSARKIPSEVWAFLKFNPLLLAIEIARDGTLWQRLPNFTHLSYLTATSLITCYLGYIAFRKMKPVFPDVL